MSRPAKLTLSVYRSLLENQGLFDFDTPITEDVFVVSSPSQIYRQRKDNQAGKTVRIVTRQQAINGDMPNYNFEMLFSLKESKEDGSAFSIYCHPYNPSSTINLQNISKLPLICLNNHGRVNEVQSYQISVGNVIKLGRMLFKVTQTHLNHGNNQSLTHLDCLNFGEIVGNYESGSQQICRICLMQGETHDQLIAPCNCKGSCKYVHLSCLKTWLQFKVKKYSNAMITSYLLAKFECQLCKRSLTNQVRIQNTIHELIEFKKPDTPYLVLQSVEQKENDKTIHVLSPQDQQIRIGRGMNVDLKLNDSSISRLHSSICFKDGRFYLKDEGSKFGSLILASKEINVEKMLCLQIGSRIYKFEEIASRMVQPLI